MKRIASDLNTDDITSPGGGTWDASAIRYILLNEIYAGLAHLEQDEEYS